MAESDDLESACSSQINPLSPNGNWQSNGKTYSTTPRTWCKSGEWIKFIPAKSVSISANTGLVELELPNANHVQPGTNFEMQYYFNPPPKIPGEPLRPYDPILICHVLSPGEIMTFGDRVNSVTIRTTTEPRSDFGPRGFRNFCQGGLTNDMRDTFLNPSFIVKIKTQGTEPRVIVSKFN